MATNKGKRQISATVKLSEDDLSYLSEAGKAHWPGAIMSRSSMILGLACIGAEKVLTDHKVKPKNKNPRHL